MKKYYIAFALLVAVTIGLAGYTVYQGKLSKQDETLQKHAEEIAEDLNDYISDENKIPADLEEAGIDDVPEGISYERNSDVKYTFCVTYKTTSSGYSAGTWEVATATLMQSYYGGVYDDYDYGPDTSLYINTYGHAKGKKCYEVEPILEEASDPNTTELSFCDPSSELYSFYQEYYPEYCEEADGSTDTLTN